METGLLGGGVTPTHPESGVTPLGGNPSRGAGGGGPEGSGRKGIGKGKLFSTLVFPLDKKTFWEIRLEANLKLALRTEAKCGFYSMSHDFGAIL